MGNSENTGFLPIVPFEGEHPEMLIGGCQKAEETFGSSEFAANTECWD